MRVFFVVPLSNLYGREVNQTEPLGVCYVAAASREEGHEVKIVHQINPEDLKTKEIINSYLHFRPHVVALSTMTESNGNGMALLRAMKDKRPVTTVLGGVHVTSCPVAALNPCVDFGVAGEGEKVLPSLLAKLERGDRDYATIPGLIWKEDGGLHRNLPFQRIAGLDDLPWPVREDLPYRYYKNYQAAYHVRISRQRLAAVSSSRGCPFDCIFCSNRIITNRVLQSRSVPGVFEEIQALIKDRAVNFINFLDEDFGINRSWLREYVEEKRRRGIATPYFANVGILDMDHEKIKLLKDSGCVMLNIGIETLDDELLLKIQKKIESRQKALMVLKEIREAGLAVTANFLIGFPWEDRGTVRQNMATVRRLQAMWFGLNFVVPFPGTKLLEMAKNEGYEVDENLDHYTGKIPIVRNRDMDQEEMIRYAASLNRAFYLRPGYLWQLVLFFLKRPFRVFPYVASLFYIGAKCRRMKLLFGGLGENTTPKP